MKFLKEKNFDLTQLTELEHQYLNHIVYLDYLYSKERDKDDDSTFDLMMNWSEIIMEHDTEVRGGWNNWDDTKMEKEYDLMKGLDFIRQLRNYDHPKSFEIYMFLYDVYCVDTNDFKSNLKGLMMFLEFIKKELIEEVEV